MHVTIATIPPPLRVDELGAIRVGSSRITLDLVIEAYQLGETPEEFAENHDSVTLAEVYATIAYYLANQQEMDQYLEEGERQAKELQYKIESEPGYREWRENLKKQWADRLRERGLKHD